MKRLLSLLILLMLPLVGVVAEADSRDPVTIVRDTTSHTLEALNERRDEFTAEPALLRELVNQDLLPLIDLQFSARLILGRAGRGVSPEQLDAFAQSMSGVLLSNYAEGLLNFRSEQQIEVLPLKGKNNEKLTRVRTRLKLDKGGSVPIDYAFHLTEQGWKAFDVTVEGISYVMTYRNQISPRVQKDGIEKVTADIQAGNIKLDSE